MTAPYPDVSIVVPCRNERGHIERCIASLLAQDYKGKLEFLIADGCSDDGTLDLLAKLARSDDRIRVLRNARKTVPGGLNIAVTEAIGDLIVRMDVHTEYSQNYVSECVRVIRETGAANVGGPWRARGKNTVQKSIAMAFQSSFSSGGARSHDEDYEGPVDSVYLGCWWRKELLEIGLFDEELVRNQDDELNMRLVRLGKIVWQSPSIESVYYPRSSITDLFRQYFQYGYWKIRVMQKHKRPASFRHVAPAMALLFFAVYVASGILFGLSLMWLAALPVVYFVATLIAAAICCYQEQYWRTFLILPFVFLGFHSGYALGSLNGVWDFLILRRGADPQMSKLTR